MKWDTFQFRFVFVSGTNDPNSRTYAYHGVRNVNFSEIYQGKKKYKRDMQRPGFLGEENKLMLHF